MIDVKAKPNFATERLKYSYDAMIEERFTDVIFTVGNRRFPAHMIVLTSCSEFFANNTENLCAIFSDYHYLVVGAIIKYCYLGEIHIEDEHFGQFMELAKKLQINCIDFRPKIIDRGHCLEVLRLSDDPMLREKAVSSALDNFNILHKAPDFLNLPTSTIAEILKSDNLNSSAEEVFHSVKLWVNYDETNRRSELAELLSFIKLTSLSIEFLIMEVMDICYSYPECIDIFKQALLSILPYYQRRIQNESHHRNSYKIALVGDYNADLSSSIDVYDEKNKTWSLSQDFNFKRSSFESVLVDDWILIIGGFYSLDKVDYIDLKDGQKHPLEPLNQGRCFFSAVTLNRDSSTDVYVIGGYNFNDYLSSVERWNSKTKIWDTNVASLLKAVDFHSAAVIDDRIYVTGGRINNDGKYKSINEVQVYSVHSNSWSYGAPMIQEREDHSSIKIKGTLYVAGGFFRETDSNLDSVESYNPDANLWTAYCNLPNPTYSPSLCFVQNKLLCMGGYSGNDKENNVWEFDVIKKSWKALKSLSKRRYFANALVIPYDSII